jgi:hypothetical protein
LLPPFPAVNKNQLFKLYALLILALEKATNILWATFETLALQTNINGSLVLKLKL